MNLIRRRIKKYLRENVAVCHRVTRYLCRMRANLRLAGMLAPSRSDGRLRRALGCIAVSSLTLRRIHACRTGSPSFAALLASATALSCSAFTSLRDFCGNRPASKIASLPAIGRGVMERLSIRCVPVDPFIDNCRLYVSRRDIKNVPRHPDGKET